MNVQTCSSAGRLNTGPLKPENDWTGVFIRTDDAMAYVQLLGIVKKSVSPELAKGLSDLQELMLSGFNR